MSGALLRVDLLPIAVIFYLFFLMYLYKRERFVHLDIFLKIFKRGFAAKNTEHSNSVLTAKKCICSPSDSFMWHIARRQMKL